MVAIVESFAKRNGAFCAECHPYFVPKRFKTGKNDLESNPPCLAERCIVDKSVGREIVPRFFRTKRSNTGLFFSWHPPRSLDLDASIFHLHFKTPKAKEPLSIYTEETDLHSTFSRTKFKHIPVFHCESPWIHNC